MLLVLALASAAALTLPQFDAASGARLLAPRAAFAQSDAASSARAIGRRAALAQTAAAALAACSVPAVCVADDDGLATATFSGGDARFMQKNFDEIRYLGVKRAVVGSLKTPNGDFPALRVVYDPKKLKLQRVVGAFWRSVDPTRTAEQGQFGLTGPTVIWVTSDEERAIAEKSKKLLDKATRFSSPTFGPMYKGLPILTEVRQLEGSWWEEGPEADQSWYVNEPKAYEAARKKTGRTKWFDDAFKAVTVTACENNDGKGNTCGFVYFPCSDENGCTGVLNGAFEVVPPS